MNHFNLILNSGKTSEEDILSLVQSILANGINVGSFGIGEEFNEQLMQGIAESGSGN